MVLLAVLHHVLCHMDTDDDLDDCFLDEESLIITPDKDWDNDDKSEKTRYQSLLKGIHIVKHFFFTKYKMVSL